MAAIHPIADLAIDRAMRLIAGNLTRNRLHTVVNGLENVPIQGPAILVARHYHHLFDGLGIYEVITRRFHFIVAIDWARHRTTRFFLETLDRLARWPAVLREESLAAGSGMLFTRSLARRYQSEAIRQSVQLLKEQRVLVIFPEGYPNVDSHFTPKKGLDEFLPFKHGFVLIAEFAERKLARPIPIVPVGINYEQGDPWIAHLNFGPALYRRDFTSRRQFVEIVEHEVKNLSARTQAPAHE